jgi:nitroreductase
MDCMDAIRGRRSIRKYESGEVTEEALRQILDAVRWAPSGGNIQPWEVIVIRDPGTREALRATVDNSNPACKTIVDAPVLLALCGLIRIPDTYRHDVVTKFGDWWFMFHLGSAAQNLSLAAHSQGLGTVMVGFFDHDRAREILQVPEAYEVVLLMPLGVPRRAPPAPKRREIDEFRHDERFRRSS